MVICATRSLELQNETIFYCLVKTGSCDYTGENVFLNVPNTAKIYIFVAFVHIPKVVDTRPTSAHAVVLN